MVIKAACDRITQLAAEKKERSQEFEATKEARDVTKEWPKRHFLQTEELANTSPLHKYEYCLDLALHVVEKYTKKGKKYFQTFLCTKPHVDPDNLEATIQYENCEHCTKEGKVVNPTLVKAMVSYLHNNEGQTWQPKDDKGDPKGEPVELSCLKIMELRYGKGATNISQLQQKIRQRGKFQSSEHVWVFTKAGSGVDSTYPCPELVRKDEIQDEGELKVPAAIVEAFDKKTEDDIAQMILAAYDGVIWEAWGLKPPTKNSTQDLGVENKEVEKGKTKNSLKNGSK